MYFCFVLKGFFFLLFPPLEDLFVTTNLHIDTESKFDFVLLGGFPHLKIRLIITFFQNKKILQLCLGRFRCLSSRLKVFKARKNKRLRCHSTYLSQSFLWLKKTSFYGINVKSVELLQIYQIQTLKSVKLPWSSASRLSDVSSSLRFLKTKSKDKKRPLENRDCWSLRI